MGIFIYTEVYLAHQTKITVVYHSYGKIKTQQPHAGCTSISDVIVMLK